MAADIVESLKTLKKFKDDDIKKEMKTTRKRNTQWIEIQSYPCPNQCLKIRYIAPRGMQKIFRTTKKVKTFLWFKKEIQIKLLTTYLPTKKDGEYFWDLIKEIEFENEIPNDWYDPDIESDEVKY